MGRSSTGVADDNLSVGGVNLGIRAAGAAEGARRLTEPSPEGALERTGVLVAEQERHFRDRQLAVTEKRWRHLPTELGEHDGERRPLLAKLALKRSSAHTQRARHTVHAGKPLGQL